MTRYLALASLFALSALAACEGAEARPAPSTAQKASASSSNEDHDLCVSMLQHARTCTDTYIPALVDYRASVDKPAGIKDMVAKDRDGTIAQAKTEWATDSSDASIERMCSQPMPNADQQRDPARACNAKTDCGEFTTCSMPLFTQNIH